MTKGRIVFPEIHSQALRNNFLADSPTRTLGVYLPPNYDSEIRSYPSVYILNGFGARGSMLLNDMPMDENIAQRMDRLIAEGKVQPMIVVLPDCLTKYGGSQYINSEGTGAYATHLIDEVVPYIDQHFHTIANRDYRAIVGKSSGGFGALILSMLHPTVFGLTASHSGDMYFELCYKPGFVHFLRGIERYGSTQGFLQQYLTCRPRDQHFKAILNTIAMASCYSPNPASELGFDLPFDAQSGELNQQVWARWLEWDPIELAEKYVTALSSQRLLFFDAGSEDEFNLQFGARILAKKLNSLGVPHVYHEFKDSHLNIPYRFDVSLSAISAAIGVD